MRFSYDFPLESLTYGSHEVLRIQQKQKQTEETMCNTSIFKRKHINMHRHTCYGLTVHMVSPFNDLNPRSPSR